MENQDLYIAMLSGTNPNRGDTDAFSDQFRNLARYYLEDDSKGACIFERFGVSKKISGSFSRLSLNAVAAELVDRLRSQTDMAHDRDLLVNQSLNKMRTTASSLELDGLGPGFLNQAKCRSHSVVGAGMKTAIRHVSNEKCPLYATANCFG